MLTANAQDISVTEFYLDEKDLTATGRHAVEDQNGDKCALIRVQTTQKGFSFDVGSAGITKVEDDHVGEIWLWVPFGIRHISIRHQQLGSLPNYDFPIAIQKARTYIMKITHDQVFVTNYDDTKKQKLTIKITPANASLFLNGMSVDLDSRGEATREMAHGQFTYKVEAQGYYPKEGQVVVNDKEHSLIINDLKPIKGKLSVQVNPSTANFKLDGRIIGRLTDEPIELQIGNHELQVSANGYKTETIRVRIEENETTTKSLTLSVQEDDSSDLIENEIYEVVQSKKDTRKGRVFSTRKDTISHKNYCKYTVRPSVRKDITRKGVNAVYFENTYQLGYIMGIGASVGEIMNGFGIEFSYLHGFKKEIHADHVVWTYAPTFNLTEKIGYAIPLNRSFYLLPQIGLRIRRIKSYGHVYDTVLSIRVSGKVLKHFTLNLTPEFNIPLTGYPKISETYPIIEWKKNLFNINVGLAAVF